MRHSYVRDFWDIEIICAIRLWAADCNPKLRYSPTQYIKSKSAHFGIIPLPDFIATMKMTCSLQAITEFILASSLHWSIPNGVLLLAIFAVFTLYRHLYLGSKHNLKRLPYPPGPKRSPIIGNLHDMPTSHPWLKFTAWAKQYGMSSILLLARIKCFL